jgi:hypothetical protein
MLAKKILASIFAVVILLKLAIGMASPGAWMRGVGWLLGHNVLLMSIYLALIIITGYYALSSVDLIDMAVVMFLTSLLVAISLVPYSAALLKLGEEIVAMGVGQAWLAALIWGALAVAVLYKVFTKSETSPGEG